MYKGKISQVIHKVRKIPTQLLGPKVAPKQIVWVGGVPRSGTNMLMASYDRHPLAHVYHEADPAVFHNYSLRSNDEIRRKFNKKLASFIVCKALLDADRLPELHNAFPGSKVIWPVRNFADVLNSHIVRWPEFRERVDEIANDTPLSPNNWRDRNMSKAARELVKSLYSSGCTNADCKALFWLYRSQLYFDFDLASNEAVLTLRYEDFTQNPAKGCDLLADFAGLPRHSAMAKGIHSKSIGKSTPPQLDSKILAACEAMQERLIAHCIKFD